MKVHRALIVLAAVVSVVAVAPPVALACSPPFERPTIRALGPARLVVLGRIGERVPGGRLFHVERWYNGGAPWTPIVIAFKEGEPVGDCSYPVATGQRKIIAPVREPDGTLHADLVTLQADPDTEDGRRYVAEAEALFGPGLVPPPVSALEHEPAPGPMSDLRLVGLVAAVVAAAVAGAVAGVILMRGHDRLT